MSHSHLNRMHYSVCNHLDRVFAPGVTGLLRKTEEPVCKCTGVRAPTVLCFWGTRTACVTPPELARSQSSRVLAGELMVNLVSARPLNEYPREWCLRSAKALAPSVPHIFLPVLSGPTETEVEEPLRCKHIDLDLPGCEASVMVQTRWSPLSKGRVLSVL
ncbi:hypothetical protein HJG60_009125 [Phyllostomus discolor]|uniref:Uncharacterized protein n=1 Tax=Phyllostomus discolor TaxID=89673 RepID=A0A833YQF9_9CHIR|nr:hypothetical protein HJG60_009125 [Phyllostomus discolor]